MNILQVNTYDLGGGAERIAMDLLHGCRARGHKAHLAVRAKRGDDPSVFPVPNDVNRNKWTQFWIRWEKLVTKKRLKGLPMTCRALQILGEQRRWWESLIGLEDYNFPGSRHLLEVIQQKPDILHFHNLHGGYFDLRILPDISKKIPTVLTLHDEWTYTGHCAGTLGCSRWQQGCGQCPDLHLPPAIQRDATAYNLRRKREIYEQSELYLVAPSQWLINRALNSVLREAVRDWKVIPNGIDLSVFHPAPKAEARQELGYSPNAWISLFVGFNTRSNKFKDYESMESAITQASAQSRRPHYLVCVGEHGKEQRRDWGVIRFVSYESDRHKLARYYQAADVYLQASHADNFPTTILEAMACGTPVVATRVGGIPEQIEDGVTGFLVPAQDSVAIADRVMRLQKNEPLRKAMGIKASQQAKSLFSLERMVEEHLNWYHKILRN